VTPTLSVGSSLSYQLNAAGLHPSTAAINNSCTKRSSTNFSTSSDNQDDVAWTPLDANRNDST